MRSLIGVDVGTTNVKALLFDENGSVLGQARRPSPIVLLEDGGGLFDAEELWEICASLIHELVDLQKQQGNPGICDEIAGIAVTGMGEAGVPMDADGKPLYPVIAWFDPRTEKYVSWWEQTFGGKKMFAITNLKKQHIFTVNKILWLKENEPDVFSKFKRWHCIPDFIAYQLTGCSAMDYSIASRTMMLDVKKKAWADEILRHAGIPQGIMPPLVFSGSKVGEVTAEAERRCGLKAGTPVFAGGHDHICGALAAGIVSPGIVLDSSGTCEEVLVTVNSLQETTALSEEGFNAGFHAVPDCYYMAGGIPASGASVDWFRREFERPLDATGEPGMPGARGLLFLPHLRGSSSPLRDKTSKGAFLGMQAHHHWEDFMQAVYEGVTFELRLSMERLLEGAPAKRVVSIGGGTLNAQWLQIKADVLQVEVEVPEVQECTAFGAALLAGIGAGVYDSVQDAIDRTFRVGRRLTPRAETKALYDRKYATYCSLYDLLKQVNEAADLG